MSNDLPTTRETLCLMTSSDEDTSKGKESDEGVGVMNENKFNFRYPPLTPESNHPTNPPLSPELRAYLNAEFKYQAALMKIDRETNRRIWKLLTSKVIPK